MAEEQATVGERGGVKRARRLVFVAVVVAAIVAIVIVNWPRTVESTGTLSECFTNWAVISLDGGDPYLPVAAWPKGLSYDHKRQAVIDASDHEVLHVGQRAAFKGTIVEVHGDPSPCYYTLGINVTSINATR